jgi:predicted transcriptional regulator
MSRSKSRLPSCGKVFQGFYLFHEMEKLTLRDFSLLPVVAPADGCRLLGVLTRRDIISAYDKAVIKQNVLSIDARK